MGFLEHLDELRRRIILACIGIGGGMVVAFVMFQVWRFIAPGLYANEKRLAILLARAVAPRQQRAAR